MYRQPGMADQGVPALRASEGRRIRSRAMRASRPAVGSPARCISSLAKQVEGVPHQGVSQG